MKLIALVISVLCMVGCKGNKARANADVKGEKPAEEINVPAAESMWYDGEIPFVFDAKANYPETKLRLSELADVSYVQMGMNDDFLVRGLMSCNGMDISITNDYVFLMDEEQYIYVTKADGTPIRVINRKGGGPEEYAYIGAYAVDTVNMEIYVQDPHEKQLYVYDIEGNFKRIFPSRAKTTGILNDSLLINHYVSNPGGLRYDVTRKSDGTQVKALPVRFNVTLPEDSHGRLAYGSLIPSPNGFFLSNLGNDTIFEVKRNLDVRPRMIDISDYGTTFAQAHPTIETNRYILFYILRSHNYKPAVEQYFYMYDKKERQIYKMKDYPDNAFWAITDDYPHITNWEVSQSPDMAVRLRQADALFESEGKYTHGELQRIIDEDLTDDSNPVLVVMRFHDRAFLNSI